MKDKIINTVYAFGLFGLIGVIPPILVERSIDAQMHAQVAPKYSKDSDSYAFLQQRSYSAAARKLTLLDACNNSDENYQPLANSLSTLPQTSLVLAQSIIQCLQRS